jgi:8-oxo-dGTP pyrophosphatase MutT (NUDIX family)
MSPAYTIVVALRPAQGTGQRIPGHEFLMIRNAKRGGTLELPGGRAEAGEAPHACARREFQEETGHDWRSPALVQRREDDGREGFVYVCRLGPAVRARESNTTQLVFVAELPSRADLSFPDDPYAQLFAAVRRRLATAPSDPARP